MRSGFFNQVSTPTQGTDFEIPKIIYFIWFGGMLCERHQPYIIATRKLNPDYTTFIYSDSNSMSDESYHKLTDFCLLHDITLVNLAACTEDDFSNLSHVRFELGLKNWARASDIARMTIMYLKGGIYLDTDLQPFKKFGTLRSKIGTLQFLAKDYRRNNELVVNIYFMAAIPSHPIYQSCIVALDKTYQIAYGFENKERWMATDDRELSIATTSLLSGSILGTIITKAIPNVWLQHIQYPLKSVVKDVVEYSWIKSGSKDMEARIAFILFIEKRDEFIKGELVDMVKHVKVALNALVSDQSKPAMQQKSGVD